MHGTEMQKLHFAEKKKKKEVEHVLPGTSVAASIARLTYGFAKASGVQRKA
jgi:hypothetical protein